MVTSVFPVTDQPVTEAQWGQLWAPGMFSGVSGSPSSTDLSPYRTAGGLFVRPGVALNCGTRFEISGADQQVSGLVANTGGSSRFDLVTVRRSSGTTSLQYIVGGSSAPAVQSTPGTTYDVPLGVATVPSGSTIPASVSDARLFLDQGVVACRVVADVPLARTRFGMVAVEQSGQVRVCTSLSPLKWANIRTGQRPAQPGVTALAGTYTGQETYTLGGYQFVGTNVNGDGAVPLPGGVSGVLGASVMSAGGTPFPVRFHVWKNADTNTSQISVRAYSYNLTTNVERAAASTSVGCTWTAVVW